MKKLRDRHTATLIQLAREGTPLEVDKFLSKFASGDIGILVVMAIQEEAVRGTNYVKNFFTVDLY